MAFFYFKITLAFLLIGYLPFGIRAQLPACKDSFPPSLLPNSSFEQYSGCNTDYGGQLEGGLFDYAPAFGGITVNSWHNYLSSHPVHYYNYGCKFNSPYSIFDTVSINNLPAYPAVSLPLPDSSGFIEIIQKFSDAGNPLNIKTSDRYICTCLSLPLYAGQPYVFNFYFGFGKTKTNYQPLITSPSPFTVAIFGREDCPSFPVKESNYGCLTKDSGWIQLGTVTMTGGYGWLQGIIEFTPLTDIRSVGIGPDCSFDYTNNYILQGTTQSYYLDKFILAPKADFSFKTIMAISGNPCTGNYVLKAPEHPVAGYQWFKDGVALNNATSEMYTVPDVASAAGSYTVRVNLPYDACINSLPYQVAFSNLSKFNLGNDTITCAPAQITLNAAWPEAQQYLWQDGSVNSSFTANKTGNYSVQLTDKYGCKKKDSANVLIKGCDKCELNVPSAFTPNNDGLNDVFRVLPGCADIGLLNYRLNIYNRFGQLIFTSKDLQKGWDGTFKKNLLDAGSYIYTINYAFTKDKPLVKKGIVQLVR